MILLVGGSSSALLEEGLHAAVGVGGHHAVAARVLHRHEAERGPGAALLVPRQLGREVQVGEHVAVGDHQPVLEDPLVERQPDRTRGAERLLLHHVAEPHALVDVAEHAPHVGRQEPAGEHHVVHAVPVEPVEHEGEEGPARQRHHGLRRGVGQRAQTRALAAGEHQRLHD